MLKYSLQFSFLFSIEYLVFMFLCFGLLAFPSPLGQDAFKMQIGLIFIAGFITIITAFIGG